MSHVISFLSSTIWVSQKWINLSNNQTFIWHDAVNQLAPGFPNVLPPLWVRESTYQLSGLPVQGRSLGSPC